MGHKIGKTPWEHVKPTKYLTLQEYKRLKRDALLLPPEQRPIILRNVSATPKMQVHVRNMQDGKTNRETNGGSYTKKKFGRTPGTTKYSFSERGKAVRIVYNVVLKKREKVKCINYIKSEIKNANFTDTNKATRIQEKLINKILTAKPNTTLIVDPRRTYKVKRQSTIAFTDSMFKRNIATMP